MVSIFFGNGIADFGRFGRVIAGDMNLHETGATHRSKFELCLQHRQRFSRVQSFTGPLAPFVRKSQHLDDFGKDDVGLNEFKLVVHELRAVSVRCVQILLNFDSRPGGKLGRRKPKTQTDSDGDQSAENQNHS